MSVIGILGIAIIVLGLVDLVCGALYILKGLWILLTEVFPSLILWALGK